MKDFNEMLADNMVNGNSKELKTLVNTKLKKIEKDLQAQLSSLEVDINKKVSRLDGIINDKPLILDFGSAKAPKKQLVHKKFNTIIKILSSQKRIDKNIMLVGPAGSSKTTLTRQVAEALGLEYVCMSVGQQTTVSNLLGFINATGQYNSTVLRDAFENGKLLCLDEFDSANPSTVTILNAMLSNGVCSFPDKMVEKHPNFICMVCCNTYGTGADLNYIGRNRLDASTLDRFITVNIDYDTVLENKLTGNKKWLSVIKKMRENIRKTGLKVVVSPRASMQGADLLEAGFPIQDVLEMVIYKGLSNDVINKLSQDIDFSIFNETSDTKSAKWEDKPVMQVLIDFDNKVSTVTDIVSDTSILSTQDWTGSHSLYFSTANSYDSKIDDKGIYLNFGQNCPLKVKSRRAVDEFCSDLYLNYKSIHTEYQDIDLVVICDGEISKYHLGK